MIGIDESTIAQWVDCHLENEPFERHFLWKSPYVLVQLVGQSSAPLAQHLIEQFEDHFRPYLVGTEITTAGEQLEKHAEVHWSVDDPLLLKYFQPTEQSTKGTPKFEVEISLSPSLEILENQEESLGHATMTIRMKGYDDDRVTFPYTRPLLGVVITRICGLVSFKKIFANRGLQMISY